MEHPPALPSFVGIDASKYRLDVHVLPSGETFAVACDGRGLEGLLAHLRGRSVGLVVVEATGGYELTVAAAIAAADLSLAVINPGQIMATESLSGYPSVEFDEPVMADFEHVGQIQATFVV